MLTRIRLIQNVGSFASTGSPPVSPLTRYVLVYAENGRGKTTVSAIFHSLATGDPVLINERHRLGAGSPSMVVLDSDTGSPPFIFRDGAWNQTLPGIVIYDDRFVNENVYSGLTVEPDHRQNLHELVIGSQGVTLNRHLQNLVRRIEEHNTELRAKGAAIPLPDLGGLSLDAFCDLPVVDDVEASIRRARQAVAAAREQESIRTTSGFTEISVPDFNLEPIADVLDERLATLDTASAARVQEHLRSLGQGAEAWVQDGMHRLHNSSDEENCPFCLQDLGQSPILEQYRAYFGEEYAALRQRIGDELNNVISRHPVGVPLQMERALRKAMELRTFWESFADIPAITFDTESLIRDWQTARDGLVALLEAKHAAPLEPIELPNNLMATIERFRTGRHNLRELSEALLHANARIEAVKAQAATSDPRDLEQRLQRLVACQRRHSPTTAPLCEQYLQEKEAKATTERQRDQTRTQIEQHRATAFPHYQTGINAYLRDFGVGFSIERVAPADTRGGATCNYDVIINNVAIPIAA